MDINIISDVFIITTKLTVTDIALVAKHKPDALRVFEGEGADRKPVFAVSYNEGRQHLASFGITFGDKTRCESGFATYKGDIPRSVERGKEKEYVADIVGTCLDYLAKIETQVPSAVSEIKTARASLLSKIRVLDENNSNNTAPTGNNSYGNTNTNNNYNNNNSYGNTNANNNSGYNNGDNANN